MRHHYCVGWWRERKGDWTGANEAHNKPPPMKLSHPERLVGQHARLVPLASEHAEGLWRAGQDTAVWEHLASAPLHQLADAQLYIAQALHIAAGGSQIPFAILDAQGRVAGSTRYMDIRAEHRALEIGWTWLGRAYQRTPINTECKYLLLREAFESMGAQRVQFKTDIRNHVSQAAIARLGAVREGVLRAYMIRRDGTPRDTVMFSIVLPEWPTVKAALEAKLARPWTESPKESNAHS